MVASTGVSRPSKKQRQLDRLFSALGDSTRRMIVVTLAQRDATISELAAPFAMTLPAISKHVAVLEAARLVSTRKEGRSRRCFLVVDALSEADEWITTCRSFWNGTLDSLAEYFGSKPRPQRNKKNK